MKDTGKQYWKGLEQLKNEPEFVKNLEKEFPEYIPVNGNFDIDAEQSGTNRRDFLKLMGFSLAAATLAACEAPIRKAIPYVDKPPEVDPGIPNYYASTFFNGVDYCSVVVKTREGRPIKIEGNSLSKITEGGTSAQVEASILSLYDTNRYQNPQKEGNDIEWQQLDNEVVQALRSISSAGGRIRIVSHSIASPSTKAALDQFMQAFPGSELVMYDAHSNYAMAVANENSFGSSIIPSYDFSKAEVIVSVAADFLGSWISPIQFIKQYSKTRKLQGDKTEMSRHYQFEPLLTLTGANADYRQPVKSTEEALVIAALYNQIARKTGETTINVSAPELPMIEQAANDLWAKRGKSMVVAGSNDPNVQELVNAINMMLGAYSGKLIDLSKPVNVRLGNDRAMNMFIEDVKAGDLDGVIFYDCNPVYDHPRGTEIAEALPGINLTLSTAEKPNETTASVKYIAPNHNFLESWNDYEPVANSLSLAQPLISPLFNTRQAQESFLTWAQAPQTEFYQFIQSNWEEKYYRGQFENFLQFWDTCLYDGIYEAEATTTEDSAGQEMSFASNVTAAANAISSSNQTGEGQKELVLYEKIGIRTGQMGNNPWLHELPDPISKACWDNYLTISQQYADEIGLEISDGKTTMLNLTVGDQTYQIPALVQPGQHKDVVGLALGYGHTAGGVVAEGLGTNAYPMVTMDGIFPQYFLDQVTVTPTDESYRLAHTQTHHTFMGRESIIQETTLNAYQQDKMAGRYTPEIESYSGPKDPESISLWKGHKYPNHHWGMMIDLNSCIGCGACTIACQVENNVPVVGKKEVLNRREMHWLRIDRYYSSESVEDSKGLMTVAENPQVVFQPMLCQQCNNAPCETVCPVAATTHSTEGLNQMTYNRCVGTRYCANNCPYKVRRFNWFKYHDNQQFADVNHAMSSDLGKMVLNPDVTVRSRGVMEKCTFCVQRIQQGKLQAKKEKRRPLDGEIISACAKACPADAIVFGDMNNPESTISKSLQIRQVEGEERVEAMEPRAYNVLNEIGVRPNVYYLTKIRNRVSEGEGESHQS